MFPIEDTIRTVSCVYEKELFEKETESQGEHWERYISQSLNVRSRRLEMLMQEIYHEISCPGFAHEVALEALATLTIVEVGRYAQALHRQTSRGSAGSGLAPWQLRRINDRIQASLEIGYPGLGELAQLCRISQSHLMRSFKASTGWQIHKYIAQERLRSAKTMLVSTSLNCKEISARLGFRNSAYFATIFRKMVGMAPSEYRRLLRTGR